MTSLLAGEHHQLGANWDGEGVNFALFSAHAEKVELCLFDATGKREIARHPLPEHTNGIWHGYLPRLAAGAVYGYRVYGPYDPLAGHRFNHHKLLLDPYAKQLCGEFKWSDRHFGYVKEDPLEDLSFDQRDNVDFMPKAVVVPPSSAEARNLRSIKKPFIPWDQTSIYEAHLRGFTARHPQVPEVHRGRFAGMGQQQVIDYIKALGISSVELMPIHAFINEHFLHHRGLENYWGYNTLSYFSAHSAYHCGAGIDEFRSMVDSFHDAGLEVILDVVYNHTCEGDHLGPTVSFRGIDNASFYQLQAAQPRYYINHTGCGNTLNVGHPMVLRMIMDSLRYWSDEMGVDGFRFDLAATLGRDQDGFNATASFFQAIAQDPELSRVKLIAEPWDIGPGGYQLGKFPAGWSEFNDSYRDTVRRYWRREPGVLPTLARRLHGSSDIFEHSGRRPFSSINYVTSHDGFTLQDMVSYNERHNLANGENNRDGHGENLSQNFGVEGASDDVTVIALRDRQKRNMLATVMVSQGVPMLLAGDELGHSLQGNNNAYCQNNELNWIDWSGLACGDKDRALGAGQRTSSQEKQQTRASELVEFISRLLDLRKKYPLLRHQNYVHPPQPADGVKIEWLDSDAVQMTHHGWLEHHNYVLGYLISKESRQSPQSSILVIFNNDLKPHEFRLPSRKLDVMWHWLIDTCQNNGLASNPTINAGDRVAIAERSVAILCNRLSSTETSA